jgi:integrase/recombinase XerD
MGSFPSCSILTSKVWSLQGYQADSVRQGKGARDRHVPIGARALLWVARYFDLVRPKLVAKETDRLFLSASGEPLCPDWLSRTTKAYIAAGAPGKRGSCHLFRHTAATLMLEGGADIRYVSEMLGHAKLETTALYTRVSISKLRAVHAATHPAGNDTVGADIRLLQPVPGAQQTS